MKTIAICFVTVFALLCTSATAQNVGLGNVIWWDMNDNGAKDANEPPMQGVQVKLYQDNNEDGVADAGFTTLTTFTDVDGKFSFGSIATGKYFVKASVGADHYKTTIYGGDPDNDVMGDNNAFSQEVTNFKIKTETITLISGTEPDGSGATNTNTNNTLGIGSWKGNGLGDMVWLDNNGNGIYEAGEPGLPNVTVTLKTLGGIVLETAITDANGKYSFYDPIGYYGVNDYQVEFGAPSGFVPTASNMGGNDDKDSDPINGVISSLNVPTGKWDHSFDAGFKPGNILPLKFTNFTATLATNKVNLSWTTANEINVNHFIIEKSLDGISYTNLAMVFSNRNGVGYSNYKYNDNISTDVAGTYYYRIRSVDVDGKNQLTEIKIIKINSTTNDNIINITAFPNPVTTELHISVPIGWQNKTVSYQLFNTAGALVSKTETNSNTINVSKLNAGIYIVKATCNGSTAEQRIIKK